MNLSSTVDHPESEDPSEKPPLAEIKVLTPITVVVPTYQERENLPFLLEALGGLVQRGIELEVLIVDDQSGDGTEEWMAENAPPWARLIVRHGPRGLSPAVVDGMRAARHPVIVVMDGDLSHPAQRIPNMILALESGQELVIGSRYVPGASTDDDWGFFRWLISKVATLLASPLTSAKDPMAGFFAMRREDFSRAENLNPIGYKIALELIVKCHIENVGEIPIHFSDRTRGKSKLTLSEQFKYLIHLRRLFVYKYATWSSLVQFLVVGASGVGVNLGVLTLLVYLAAPTLLAVAGGIFASMVSNFLLNRQFTFYYGRTHNILEQFAGFSAASSFAAVVNFGVTIGTLHALPTLPVQWAALAGIAAGTGINFVVNRYFVFKIKT